jgi:methyl-accepting chemotaxis protein
VVNGVEELYGESERSSNRMISISESTRGLISSADESGQRLAGAVRISSDLVKKSTFIATRTKQLMEQMQVMSEVAEQNLSVAAEVEDVSSAMAEKSENLRENLGRFRC